MGQSARQEHYLGIDFRNEAMDDTFIADVKEMLARADVAEGRSYRESLARLPARN
jgi:hypothetical protein